MDSTERAKPADAAQAMRIAKAFVSTTPDAPGRRPFFKYRDLGIEAASNGRMRASHSTAIAGMLQETGWHSHTCEMQFVYVLKGTIRIEFEDGTVGTFNAGEALFIPGGMRHNEIYASEDKETLEITVPGKIDTVECERPAGLPAQLREVSAAQP